jgi:hypothetical protein
MGRSGAAPLRGDRPQRVPIVFIDFLFVMPESFEAPSKHLMMPRVRGESKEMDADAAKALLILRWSRHG